MRYALLFVFFALIIQKERSRATTSSDFRPIPIPLEQWNYEKREAKVVTLQEVTKTEKPPTSAAVPAHYWEDALRHSVYLTLVRDKIDQLIAKGTVVSPNSTPDHYTSKEVDDHDLWDKIKTAPFDRIEEGNFPSFGDVTIMAKGRLTEENGSFRFIEDNLSERNCSNEKCMADVKAFWSVKRIRQRDEEISPARYHYELTFSVTSQKPKKQKRPFENPVRTFTVRETPPEIIVATPQEQPYYQTVRPQIIRPQRAIWFHKNIAPTSSQSQARYHHQGLDRIFSSFFSDDDEPVKPSPRYKPNLYIPPMYPPKLGYVGFGSDQHQQKKPLLYSYKPNMYKYIRPPLQAPPLSQVQHHYIDMEAIINNPYGPPATDHRYISSSNIVKTTRPAILPSSPTTNFNTMPKNISLELNYNKKDNVSKNIKKEPEIPVHKPYSSSTPRPQPIKINYFPEHIRPPVYNAPPGVFVTMDKKPFKPMPPLKLIHPTKPFNRPIDFRPSPQVLDVLSSNTDTTVESAFRPILGNFTETEDTEKTELRQIDKHINKHLEKQINKKPPKKHENIKSQRITTSAPDIITVNSELDDYNDTMQWANILGAFTKTTPMEPQKDKQKEPDTTTEHIPPPSSTIIYKSTTVKNEEKTTTTTTATPALKKRTRPPHTFVKPEKPKKHKRITTTTKAPDKAKSKKTSDLTPQASSAATKTWQPKNKTTTIIATTSSTTSISATTEQTTMTVNSTTPKIFTTSIIPASSTSFKIESINKPVHDKSKNRFRQSTLMQKGTSVKHDRWSISPGTEKKITAATSGKHPPRRKGSNFQGYGSSLTKHSTHNDEYLNSYTTESSKQPEANTKIESEKVLISTQPTYEEIVDQFNFNSESTSGFTKIQDQDEDDSERDDIEVKIKNEEESEDNAEFIFDLSSTTPSEKTNEIIEEDTTVTEQTVLTTSHSVTKNKTRCKKKKKQQHLTQSVESVTEDEESAPTTTSASTTKISSSLGILDELLGSLAYDPTVKPIESKLSETKELHEEGSEKHGKYLNIDEDFEDFLDIEDRNKHPEGKEEEYEGDEKEPSIDDDDNDEDVSPFDNDDVNESSRNSSDKEYEDYHDRSYSLLELMAME